MKIALHNIRFAPKYQKNTYKFTSFFCCCNNITFFTHYFLNFFLYISGFTCKFFGCGHFRLVEWNKGVSNENGSELWYFVSCLYFSFGIFYGTLINLIVLVHQINKLVVKYVIFRREKLFSITYNYNN
jgi:hypothetical protein